MTTGATGQLGLALPVQGELSGTWGDTVNNGITQYTNIAIAATLTNKLLTTASDPVAVSCTSPNSTKLEFTASVPVAVSATVAAYTGTLDTASDPVAASVTVVA